MKKVIFLILFSYSSLSFCFVPQSFDYYDALIGQRLPCLSINTPGYAFNNFKASLNPQGYHKFTNNDFCTFIRWDKILSPNYTFSAFHDIEWHMQAHGDPIYPAPFPFGSNFYFLPFVIPSPTQNINYTTACLAFVREWTMPNPPAYCNNIGYYQGRWYTGGINDSMPIEVCTTFPESKCYKNGAPIFNEDYYSLMIVKLDGAGLQKSEKTAETENDLHAESNSKLGSIANSKATEAGLLNDIKDLFKSLSDKTSKYISKQKCDYFAICEGSDTPPESDDSVPELNSENVDVSTIQPLISGSGSCPSDISLNVLNQDYSISFQPMCEFASRVRPVVIWSARVSAAWIVFGAL